MTTKITKLKITNYRGVAELEVPVGDAATVAQGRNAAGKSTVLHALRAALAAQDIGPDAIRHGADSAEILVDLGSINVRRGITRKGTSLVVSKDGFVAQKPQTFLSELVGSSPIDPLDLLLLKPKDRRSRILEALPCTVTRAQLEEWAPTLPGNFDATGHGMDVLERARTLYYDRRTSANAVAKESDGTAKRARAALGDVTVAPEGMTVADATTALDFAKREETRLSLRRDEAVAQEKRNTKARGTIADRRATAASNRGEVADVVDEEPLQCAAQEASDLCLDLERRLADARLALQRAQDARQEARKANAERERLLRVAAEHEAEADRLEAALVDGGITPPTPEDVATAADHVTAASVALAKARGAEQLAKRIAEVEQLEAAAALDQAAADALDEVVKRLTNDAPRAIAATDAIPGLSLSGDEVLLDGVGLDTLCGAEQMKLCVAIAKRASGKGRFLVVDGLERIDPESFESFVREVTKDGTQLFGSRVTRGSLEFVHIAAEAVSPAPSDAPKTDNVDAVAAVFGLR